MATIFKKDEAVPAYLLKQVPKEGSELGVITFNVDCLVTESGKDYMIRPLKPLSKDDANLIRIEGENLKLKIIDNPFNEDGCLILNFKSVEELNN